MRSVIAWVLLTATFAATTAVLGWWTVPVVAALWGLHEPIRGRTWVTAPSAAAAAWAGLLLITAIDNPVVVLASKLGGALGVPGFVVVLLALALPALLAGSAAELAAVLWTAVGTARRPSNEART